MRNFRNTFLLLLISATAFAQIGAKVQQQDKIHGSWQNSQFGYQMTLMLNPDGSGEFDGEPIKYSTQADKLAITVGTVVTNYSYEQKGNSLTLSGGDLDGKVTFMRNGTDASQEAVTGNNSDAHSKTSYSNTASNLIGLWSGNGEMIEFKMDGKCVYLGNTFPYEISQGHVILTSPQGKASFAYEVKGSQLTLTANGQQVLYNKVTGAATGGQNNPATKGGVALELVGEWCYMNMNTNSQTSRCIVLNGDGTYVYKSESSRSVNTPDLYGATSSQGGDRGTWYVQGDRIYYNSQTSGQGSYRLEKRNHPKNVNDPMIVLDGEPYVTTTNRAPWR